MFKQRDKEIVSFSDRASLALHAMGLLARNPQRRLLISDFATALRASVNHLYKVMQRLAKAGLVESVAGRGGGFILVRSAGDISLLEIYEAIEGPLADPGCLLAEPVCQKPGECRLGDLLQSMNRQMRRFLSETTLDELAGEIAVVELATK